MTLKLELDDFLSDRLREHSAALRLCPSDFVVYLLRQSIMTPEEREDNPLTVWRGEWGRGENEKANLCSE